MIGKKLQLYLCRKSITQNYLVTLGVSLLPLPGKIIEKLLYNQLIRHFENNTLLNPKQNGFRKLHNTSDTVFKLCYDLSNSMNRKHPTAAVFVDFAKAFDSIDHVKLVALSSIEMTLVLIRTMGIFRAT